MEGAASCPRERMGDHSHEQQHQQENCNHFLQTGTCAYGRSCKFNHPVNGRAVFGPYFSGGDYSSAEKSRWEQQQQQQQQQQLFRQLARHPERPGQPECPHYAQTGTCKFGATCKFHHTPERVRSSPVATSTLFLAAQQAQAQRGGVPILNGSRYPLRPGQKDCDFYMKTGQCKYGVTCKFNHPELIAAAAPGSRRFLDSRIPVFGPKPGLPMAVPPVTTGAGVPMPSGAPAIPVGTVAVPWPMRPVGMTRFQPAQPAHGQLPYLIQHPGSIVYLPPGWNYQYAVPPPPIDHSHLLSRPQPQHQSNSTVVQSHLHQQQHAQPMLASTTPTESASIDGGSFYLPPRGHLPLPPLPPPPPAVVATTSSVLTGPGSGTTVMPLAGSAAAPFPLSATGLLAGNPNVNLINESSDMPSSMAAMPVAQCQPATIGLQGVMPLHNGAVGVMLVSPTLQQQHRGGPFPERPGQQECRYYMRTGDCKFGMSCRFHHPRDRSTAATAAGVGNGAAGPAAAPQCALNPIGYPLRPGEPQCAFYVRNGHCRFAQTCKFDHPVSELEYCPSASSLVDMPVAPLPERSAAAAAAVEEESGLVRAGVGKGKEEGKYQGAVDGSKDKRGEHADAGPDGRGDDDDEEEDYDVKGEGKHCGAAAGAVVTTTEEVMKSATLGAPTEAVVVGNSS